MVNDTEDMAKEILDEMWSLRDERNIEGMSRYGINVENALGISMVWMRERVRSLPKSNDLAAALWASHLHEPMIMAALVAVPKTFKKHMALEWVKEFDSWDLCDHCCSDLFALTPYARELVAPWCDADEEFVRRAGFVMMAALAVKDKRSPSSSFGEYLAIIEGSSGDGRNNVKKAINWALRQIGKRDMNGYKLALPVAERLASSTDRTARWIGRDAYRELTSPKIVEMVRRKALR
ncbi:MAG: DNA alkylation repair protein [Euryarchaeota archaeon]|nr:DNA alkylation repair protein [Euryarchaeota archaeon]